MCIKTISSYGPFFAYLNVLLLAICSVMPLTVTERRAIPAMLQIHTQRILFILCKK